MAKNEAQIDIDLFNLGLSGFNHNFSTKRLQRYVNEFTFRLNEGNCQVDTRDRMVSLFKGIGNNRISYKELTA